MLEEKLKTYFDLHPLLDDVDLLSIGYINFDERTFEKFTLKDTGEPKTFFDLASITKPLTIGLVQFICPEFKKIKDLDLLLNHCSGLPSWGLLSCKSWRDQILSYQISKSSVLYSDFGALRAQIEFEKENDANIYDSVKHLWHDEILHWTAVKKNFCLCTGERGFKKIVGDVHDPNAWTIKRRLSHAGLFSTLDGLCNTLLKLEREFSIIDYFIDKFKTGGFDRFINGWDTAFKRRTSLAGDRCSDYTVGHLGFTGTSFWIDCERRKGVVILSNITRDGWYNKKNLNTARRDVADIVWDLREG